MTKPTIDSASVETADPLALLTEFLWARTAEEETGERDARRRVMRTATQWLSNDQATPWARGTAEEALRHLALSYADHEDYCEEWKP